jgi:hypothetical protein
MKKSWMRNVRQKTKVIPLQFKSGENSIVSDHVSSAAALECHF